MSVLTQAADRMAIEDVDDDLHHFVCCDDDVTLCGRYVPGDDWADFGVDDPGVCEVCANKERLGLPCPDPDCGRRSS